MMLFDPISNLQGHLQNAVSQEADVTSGENLEHENKEESPRVSASNE